MKHSRKVYESTSTVTDLRTGEAVQHVSQNVVRLSQEPAYVKLYTQDLANLKELNNNEKSVLYMLVCKIDFEGIVSLNASSRKRIAKTCGISDGSFRNAISGICKKDIMRRIEPNEYEVNPHYFAKGEWRSIKERRKGYELNIRYTADGERIVTTRAVEDES